jgi:hypothetical protein
MLASPRCGARTRSGMPCRSPAVRGQEKVPHARQSQGLWRAFGQSKCALALDLYAQGARAAGTDACSSSRGRDRPFTVRRLVGERIFLSLRRSQARSHVTTWTVGRARTDQAGDWLRFVISSFLLPSRRSLSRVDRAMLKTHARALCLIRWDELHSSRFECHLNFPQGTRSSTKVCG